MNQWKNDDAYLEHLAQVAGDMKFDDAYQTPPKQWLPGFIRWPLRLLILPFVILDLWMQAVAKFLIRPPFKRMGTCKRRGNCCYYIIIGDPGNLMGFLHHLWSTQVNGFFDRMGRVITYEGKKGRLYGCRYLKRNGSCKHHFLRPSFCRKWPFIQHFGKPRVLKGCGFYPKSKYPIPGLESVEKDVGTVGNQETTKSSQNLLRVIPDKSKNGCNGCGAYQEK